MRGRPGEGEPGQECTGENVKCRFPSSLLPPERAAKGSTGNGRHGRRAKIWIGWRGRDEHATASLSQPASQAIWWHSRDRQAFLTATPPRHQRICLRGPAFHCHTRQRRQLPAPAGDHLLSCRLAESAAGFLEKERLE